MKLTRQLLPKLFRSFIAGLFMFFLIKNHNILIHSELGLHQLIGTSLFIPVCISLFAVGLAWFWTTIKANVSSYFQSFLTKNPIFIYWINKIAPVFCLALLLSGLFYFLLIRDVQQKTFRSLKVELAKQEKGVEIWQIYFYTNAGYTALEREDAELGNEKVNFPIKTQKQFSKLRIDPGDSETTRSYRLKRIILEKNNQLFKQIEGKALYDLIQPNKEIESFLFDEITQEIAFKTASSGDPFLELKISDKDFKEILFKWDAKSAVSFFLIFFIVFLFLFFFERIKKNLEQAVQNPQKRFLTSFILALAIGVLSFILAQNRDKIYPLKVLTIHFDEALAIPQDLWKAYLKIDGAYSENFAFYAWSIGKTMRFSIPTSVPFDQIRLDPGISQHEFVLKEVKFWSGWECSQKWVGQSLFKAIHPINQITNVGLNPRQKTVKIQTQAGDPFFEIEAPSKIFEDNSLFFEIVLSLSAFLAAFLLFYFLSGIRQFFDHPLQNGLFFFTTNILIFIFNLYLLGDWHYSLLFFILFWLFVLPGLFLLQKADLQIDSLLARGILSFAVGIGFILFLVYIPYCLNIAYGYFLGLIISIGIGLFYLKVNLKQINKQNIRSIFSFKNNAELLFFNGLFFLFMSPINGLLASPLQDPAVIANIANDILNQQIILDAVHYTLKTYPPYLQIMTALSSQLSFLSTPKSLLFLTNFFTLLSGLSFGFLWAKWFDTKYAFWLSSLLFLFISPNIPELYFTAGKNAMIISIFYWFISLWLSLYFFDKKVHTNKWLALTFVLAITAGFQFNYISIFIFPIFILYFLQLIIRDRKLEKKQFSRKYSQILLGGLLPGLIFSLFAVYQYKSSLIHEKYDLLFVYEGSKQQSADKLLAANSPPKKKEIKVPRPTKNFYFYYTQFHRLLAEYAKEYSLFRYPWFSISIGLFLLLLFIFNIHRQSVFFVLGFSLIIVENNFSSYSNLIHYSKVLRFFVPILSAAFLLNLLFYWSKKSSLISFLLFLPILFISLSQSIDLFNNYQLAKRNSILTTFDLDAFEFIDRNLSDKEYIMPLNLSNLVGKYPSNNDASIFLNFTKSEAPLSFIQGKLILQGSLDFIKLKNAYRNWLNDKPNSESRLFSLMHQLNINYFYSGSFTPFGLRYPLSKLQNNPKFSVIYDKNGAKIYKINYPFFKLDS